jgi:hypothetical protein
MAGAQEVWILDTRYCIRGSLSVGCMMRAGEKAIEESRYIPDPPPVTATIFPLIGKSPTVLDTML